MHWILYTIAIPGAFLGPILVVLALFPPDWIYSNEALPSPGEFRLHSLIYGICGTVIGIGIFLRAHWVRFVAPAICLTGGIVAYIFELDLQDLLNAAGWFLLLIYAMWINRAGRAYFQRSSQSG